jgi:hypothetical protein
MEDERGTDPLAGAAALEHLTGPSRGTVTWLSGLALDISLSATSSLSRGMTPPGQAGGRGPGLRCSSGLLTARRVVLATWL